MLPTSRLATLPLRRAPLSPLHSSILRRHYASLPINPEWAQMAKKELKGKDPEETLTWRTAEV